jgi:hypothetical protein
VVFGKGFGGDFRPDAGRITHRDSENRSFHVSILLRGSLATWQLGA